MLAAGSIFETWIFWNYETFAAEAQGGREKFCWLCSNLLLTRSRFQAPHVPGTDYIMRNCGVAKSHLEDDQIFGQEQGVLWRGEEDTGPNCMQLSIHMLWIQLPIAVKYEWNLLDIVTSKSHLTSIRRRLWTIVDVQVKDNITLL